jgi:ATP-dependent RNA helicase RhlE
MFFSATMPREISTLAQSILTNPVRIEVTPVSSTVDTIQQHIFFTEKENKLHLLKHVLSDDSILTALVFTRTKHGADKLSKFLNRSGIKAEAIHGNKSQGARQSALRNFKNRATRILVATDIAARGIDIDDLTHVFNFELPEVPETYVHRIGRTGRAGASGKAFSFCAFEEKPLLRDIQKLISKNITVVQDHPYAMSQQLSDMREPPRQAQPPKSAGSRGGGGKRGRGLFRPAPAR